MINRKHFTVQVQVVVHSSLNTVIADTRAEVSVYSTAQARKWRNLSKILPKMDGSIKMKLDVHHLNDVILQTN